MADYSKAIELDPKFTDAYNGKGMNMFKFIGNVLKAMKRYDEALEDYSKAIAIDPKFVNAYNGKGILFYIILI